MKTACRLVFLVGSFALGAALVFPPAQSVAADTKAAVGEIKGKVTQSGKPLAGCQVYVFPRSGGNSLGQATTEKDGTYSIKKVAVGDLDVRVLIPQKEGEATCSQGKSVMLGEKKSVVADFDFAALTDTGTIEGTVKMDGQPIKQGTATYRFAGGERQGNWSTSIKDGAFSLGKLTVGAGTLGVHCEGKEGRWLNKRIAVKIEKDQTLRQDIEFSSPGKVTAKVNGIKDGEAAIVAIVGGKFQADKLDDAVLRKLCGQALGQARLQSDGAFAVDQAAPGPNTIVAWIVGDGKDAPARFCMKEVEVKGGDAVTAELTLP